MKKTEKNNDLMNAKADINFVITLPTSDDLKANVNTINFYKEMLSLYSKEKKGVEKNAKVADVLNKLICKERFEGEQALDIQSLFLALLSVKVEEYASGRKEIIKKERELLAEVCKKKGVDLPPVPVYIDLSEIINDLNTFCELFKVTLKIVNSDKEDKAFYKVYNQIREHFGTIMNNFLKANEGKIKPNDFNWLPIVVLGCLQTIKDGELSQFDSLTPQFAQYFTKAISYCYNRQIDVPNFKGNHNEILFDWITIFIFIFWQLKNVKTHQEFRGHQQEGTIILNGKTLNEHDKKGNVSFADGKMTITDLDNNDDSDDEE